MCIVVLAIPTSLHYKSILDFVYEFQIGDRVVPLHEVTSDMLETMNDEEKERYRKVHQLAMSHAEFC